MLYMAQIGDAARRASRSRSTRAPRVTRDYAYFVENRLRERYGARRHPADHRLRRAQAAAQRRVSEPAHAARDGSRRRPGSPVARRRPALAWCVRGPRRRRRRRRRPAARLVPADALVYVHLSTDPEPRARTSSCSTIWRTLPGATRALRERSSSRLAARRARFDLDRDVRPWLGDEAASRCSTRRHRAANSLLAARRSRDRAKAAGRARPGAGARTAVRLPRRARSERFGARRGRVHRRLPRDRPGGRGARARSTAARGHGPRARRRAAPTARATRERPDDRALDLYARPDGVRRVLAAQSGPARRARAAARPPASCAASALSLARPRTRPARARPPGAQRARRRATFEPAAARRRPGRRCGLPRPGRPRRGRPRCCPRPARRTLRRLRTARCRPDCGVDLDRDVLEPLRGEVALLGHARPAGARSSRSSRARATSAHARGARRACRARWPSALAPAAEQGGPVPTFEERDLGDGVTPSRCRSRPGVELAYAVVEGGWSLSTRPRGDRAALKDGRRLRCATRKPSSAPWMRVPEQAEALVFLDLGQLLALGERGGTRRRSGASGRVRDDLRKVRAVGAAVVDARGDRHDRGASSSRSHEPVRRQRVPVHLRVRHEGHPDKVADQISDGVLDAVLRDDPYGPRRLRDARQHRPRRRLRRDLDRRPTSTSRRSPARRSARSATSTPTSASPPTPAPSSTRSTSSRPTSPRASTRRYEARTDPSDDDELDVAGAGDQGMMFGYASQRDRRADAAPDLARAPARRAPRRRPQGRHARLPAPRRQDPGLRPLPRRPCRSRSRSS